jgi:hypothetical protein
MWHQFFCLNPAGAQHQLFPAIRVLQISVVPPHQGGVDPSQDFRASRGAASFLETKAAEQENIFGRVERIKEYLERFRLQ